MFGADTKALFAKYLKKDKINNFDKLLLRVLLQIIQFCGSY